MVMEALLPIHPFVGELTTYKRKNRKGLPFFIKFKLAAVTAWANDFNFVNI